MAKRRPLFTITNHCGAGSSTTFIVPTNEYRHGHRGGAQLDAIKLLLEAPIDQVGREVVVRIRNYTRGCEVGVYRATLRGAAEAQADDDNVVFDTMQIESLHKAVPKHDSVWQVKVTDESSAAHVRIHSAQLLFYETPTDANHTRRCTPLFVASSSVTVPWVGSFACDDDSRFWMSDRSPYGVLCQQWLLYDMGRAVLLHDVRLVAAAGKAGRRTAVQGSADGKEWQTLHEVPPGDWEHGMSRQTYHAKLSSSEPYRFVRLVTDATDYVMYETVAYGASECDP
jgi:hypothetical protein